MSAHRHASGAPPRVGAGWFALFTLVWLAIWTVQLTPLQLLIPLQLDTADDPAGWISGVVASGLVLAAGGLAGVVAGPVAGALSDRTRSRFGRRRPWALGGVLLAAAALGALAIAADAWQVGAAWVGVCVGTAVAAAAFTALIADQLTAQRGAASAAVSSSQALGIVVGVGVITLLELGMVVGYLVLAAFLAVAGVGAALALPDPPAPAGRPTRRAGRARMTRAFGWLLASRLIVNVGNALGTSLLLFFLLYGLHTDAAAAEDQLLTLIVVYTVFTVIASVLAGVVSDRAGGKVPLSVLAALVQGAAALVLAVAPSPVAAAVAAALLGVGYGAYMSVSLSLATDLLPTDADHARDLGLVTVAAALGQLLGPLIGAGLVAAVAGFWLLFTVAAAVSVVGGVLALAVRVRAPQTTASAAR